MGHLRGNSSVTVNLDLDLDPSRIGQIPPSQVEQTAAPFITGRLRNRDQLSATNFGVKMDGSDETAKLQDLVAAAQGAVLLPGESTPRTRSALLPAGQTLVTSNLIRVENQALNLKLYGEGSGHTTLIHGYDGHLIQLIGSMAAVATVTAPSSIGDQQLTVDSTVGYGTGDLVWVRDPTNPILGSQGSTTGDARAVGGEPAVVRSASGNTLMFYGKLLYPYTNGSDIRKMTGPSPVFKGFGIVNPSDTGDTSNARGLYLRYTRNPLLEDLMTDKMAGASFYLWGAVGFRVIDVEVRNGQDVEQEAKGLGSDGKPQGPYPYGVLVGRGSAYGLIRGLQMFYGRHAVTTASSETEIPPQHVTVENSFAYGFHHAAFDTHPGSRWFTFRGNTAVSGSVNGIYGDVEGSDVTRLRAFGHGFQLRGPDSQVIDGTVRGAVNGVFIANAADRARVWGGNYQSCDQIVRVRNSNDVQIGGGIRGDSPTLDGIYVEAPDPEWFGYVNKLTIGEANITGDPSGAALTFEPGAWQPGFRVSPQFTAPDATRKSSGITSPAPNVTVAPSVVLP